MRPPTSTASGNLRSLGIIQILSGIVCITCAIYLILSIVAPSSLHSILGGLHFQSWQRKTNVPKFITDGKQKSTNLNNESFICDYVKPINQHNQTSSVSFEKHRLNSLRPYCDIVPTPRNEWIPADRYTESDIVFLIFTGAKFYHNRATSIRDTWLSRVTHKYFFSSTPYPTLPITVIEGVGEDYLSNMRKSYIGMQIAYEEHNQTAKFYFLAGCDTFVNVPHILKRLNNFDYTQPVIVGGFPFEHKCYVNKKETAHSITYPSGGAGFFLSARMMEMMYPRLTSYFEDDWLTIKDPFNDVAINCLAYSMGIKPSLVPGFWAFSPEATIKGSGREEFHADPEPNTFHYVQPNSMYILDEFYAFQHIDRLSNDENLKELVKFTRQFVAAHYELLRIKRTECTLPKIKPDQDQF